jgi:cytochrome b pre-mRNA-processing protein 3|tara:strand:- start:2252 stop:2719 length:468 start_codon:yes stop_codon:yes gene_type:complete
MDYKYINIYNNLINLTRNKKLYKDFKDQDTFSDRLLFFLFHFAFFLKVFKTKKNKKLLQNIYDYIFRVLELSIREKGYGDATINKKMKIYLNLFHTLINKIDKWEDIDKASKNKILSTFFMINMDKFYLVDYFDKYLNNLSKNTLNLYIKGVVKH